MPQTGREALLTIAVAAPGRVGRVGRPAAVWSDPQPVVRGGDGGGSTTATMVEASVGSAILPTSRLRTATVARPRESERASLR